jgi:hypothetical protein
MRSGEGLYQVAQRRFLTVMVFSLIMLGALGVALLGGWVTWRREEKARQAAQLRQDEVEMAEGRLAENARRLRSKDRH